jgi:hypothetical protein
MAKVPFWLDEFLAENDLSPPGAWDRITIAGKKLPGLAIVNADSQFKVDPKKSPGKSGATPTFHGRRPADIDIQVIIWTEDQLDELTEQLVVLWPAEPDRKKPQPVDVYHPSLALLGIKSMYLTQVSGLKPGPVSKSMSMSMKAHEYRRGGKKSESLTPDGSAPPNVIAPARLQQSANAPQALPSTDTSFTNPR